MKRTFIFNCMMLAALVSIILLTIYATVQQSYRTGLNDPQMQIAGDLRLQIEKGGSIESYFRNDTIDIRRSLSPFIVLYDNTGKPIRYDALLDGKPPQVPADIFFEVRQEGEYDVSWQPRDGVRMAMVIVKTNSKPTQFIAVGRSMAVVENRTANVMMTILMAWTVSMGVIIFIIIINYINRNR